MAGDKQMTPLQVQLLLGCLGLFVALAGWSAFDQGYRGMYVVDTWKPVEATVVSSEVTNTLVRDESSTSRKNITVFLPHIEYRYEFGGKEYRTDQYSLHYPSNPSYDPVKKIIDAHPMGKRFTVYVNPKKPSEAVINRDKKPAWPIMIFGGVFMVLGAGVFMIAVWLFVFGGKSRLKEE